MENLNALLVIPLKSSSGEEHVGDLPEGQGSMRVQELNTGRSDVDIPLSEVGMSQHKQINDVGETEWNTGEQNRKEAHSLLDVVHSINVDALHNFLLERLDLKEFSVAGEVDGEAGKYHVQDSQGHQE